MLSQTMMVLERQAVFKRAGAFSQSNRESWEVLEQGVAWTDLRQVWEFERGPGGNRSCDPDGRKVGMS